MRLSRLAVATMATIALASSAAALPAPATAKPPWTKNCTALNKKYPHGIGKAKARDKSSDKPVTNFKRSTKLYNLAMSHNKGLDRDKDGVACEQD